MNKLINGLLLSLFFLLMFSCEDPDVLDPDQAGIWKYYNTSNGLTNDDIRAIVQDHAGSIWVGTYGGGVCKYDNGNWSSIRTRNGLLDDRIYSITEDIYDNIWIGTAYGISVISGDRIVNFETILDSYYLPLSLCADSRGWVWIGTTMGIFKYDQGDFTSILFVNEVFNWIWNITEDNLNQIWFSTPGGALAYNNEDELFHVFDIEDGLYSNNVRCIFQDSWGNIWFGHLESERITRWNGNRFEFINLFNGLNYANVWSIVEDNNRNIWFTTAHSGVICYDGVIPKTIGIKSGLKDYDIRCSMVDFEGNLWFGSDSLGIQVYIPE